MLNCKKILCFATTVIGLILVGLGVFLLATGFAISFITIGVIVAGILLLVIGCLGKCLKIPGLLCLLLTLITLFLIIAGVLAISVSLIIGLILIGLGVLTMLLTVICLINSCCCIRDDQPRHY